MRTRLCGSTLAVILASTVVACAQATQADTVYLDATFYTVDPDHPTAEAMAVRDGTIAYIGDEAGVQEYIQDTTLVETLDGAFVMPAMYDLHIHGIEGEQSNIFDCQFGPTATIEEIAARIAQCAEASDEPWITGGFFAADLVDTYTGRPVREVIDEVSRDRAVFLFDYSHHHSIVNSRALEIAEIDATTEAIDGGIIHTDESGEPNGFISETQIPLIQAVIPQRTDAEMDLVFETFQARMHSHGLIGWREAFAQDAASETYARNEANGELSSFVSLCRPAAFTPEAVDALVESAEGLNGDYLRADCAKIFIDGIMPTRTALMLDPYLPVEAGDHDHAVELDRGHATMTPEAFNAAMILLDRAGILVKTHASADGSARMVLDAIEAARTANGTNGPAHEVAHSQLISDQDVARFAELNAVAEFSPVFWYPSPLLRFTLEPVIGAERVQSMYRINDVLETGARVVAGSDWPLSTPNPFPSIEAMLTRQNPYSSTDYLGMPYLNRDQAITIEQAIRIYTLANATQMGRGDTSGSLTAGKRADFIVLDRNLLEVDADRISDTIVVQTVFGGEVTHNLDRDEVAVRQHSEMLRVAIAQEDIQTISRLYHGDAVVVTAGAAPISGREAITGFFAGIIEQGIEGLHLDITSVTVDGDTAIEVGTYTLRALGGAPADTGNYLVQWSRTDRGWVIASDFIVTDQTWRGP